MIFDTRVDPTCNFDIEVIASISVSIIRYRINHYRFKPLDIESANSISMIFINIEHDIVYDIGIQYRIHINVYRVYDSIHLPL
jgi:hypothetical protein